MIKKKKNCNLLIIFQSKIFIYNRINRIFKMEKKKKISLLQIK
jgi:hypothetical protein